MDLTTQNYVFLDAGFLIATILGIILIPRIHLISYKKQLFDIPDWRKVHKLPILCAGILFCM